MIALVLLFASIEKVHTPAERLGRLRLQAQSAAEEIAPNSLYIGEERQPAVAFRGGDFQTVYLFESVDHNHPYSREARRTWMTPPRFGIISCFRITNGRARLQYTLRLRHVRGKSKAQRAGTPLSFFDNDLVPIQDHQLSLAQADLKKRTPLVTYIYVPWVPYYKVVLHNSTGKYRLERDYYPKNPRAEPDPVGDSARGADSGVYDPDADALPVSNEELALVRRRTQ